MRDAEIKRKSNETDIELFLDIDGSGEIDIADATTVLEYYACTAAGMIFDTPINAETADIDGSDETSISDATYILTYYAKKAAGLECSWNEIIGG